jgi:hypothetical protein
LSRLNSTSLTLDELISRPSNGASWRLNKDPKEIKVSPQMTGYRVALLT